MTGPSPGEAGHARAPVFIGLDGSDDMVIAVCHGLRSEVSEPADATPIGVERWMATAPQVLSHLFVPDFDLGMATTRHKVSLSLDEAWC